MCQSNCQYEDSFSGECQINAVRGLRPCDLMEERDKLEEELGKLTSKIDNLVDEIDEINEMLEQLF